MTVTVKSLLRSVDGLAFPARQRALARTARDLRGTDEFDRLLAELHDSDWFGRQTALLMAAVAGHERHVLRCLDAPEPSLALSALNVAVRRAYGSAEIVAMLPDAPTAWRQAVYRMTRRHHAVALAERLLTPVRERYGAGEVAALLGACGEAAVVALLPEVDHAVANWRGLARRHPGAVLDHVAARLEAAAEAALVRTWARYGSAAAAVAATEPARVLTLLERYATTGWLPWELQDQMAVLARFDPGRTMALLTDPRRQGQVFSYYHHDRRGLWRALRAVDDGPWAELARALSGRPDALRQVLRGLPPSRRVAVLAGALGTRDLRRAGLPWTVLDLLPAPARHDQARMLLAQREVADDPAARLAVAARLPWAESEPVLRPAAARATAEERAEAYPLLVRAAVGTREPATFAAVVASLTRLANEQDPVRAAALAALAEVPTWLYAETDPAAVSTLLADALAARDTSWRTQDAVRQLATALLREGLTRNAPRWVECGLTALRDLGLRTGWLRLHGLGRDLPRRAERTVYQALAPRIEMDGERDLYGPALTLVEALGRRAWEVPELQRWVERALDAKQDQLVRRAVELWLDPPGTRAARVEAVLARDPSTITIYAVSRAVATLRTDLLDQVLGGSQRGRFLSRRARHLPEFGTGHRRWLPRQVRTYADQLTALADGPAVPTLERILAIRVLGRLPGVGAAALQRHLADPEVSVVEAALTALAWTDDPAAALPSLLAHAGTDRARVAVYAATRCARFVPGGQLAAMLGPVVAGPKVTSRKEALRLVTAHRVPGAMDLLAAAWSRPGQHRDVRRAVVSAARELLDDERAWTVLSEAAAAGNAVATAVAIIPPEAMAEHHRHRFAALVATVAASGDPDVARRGIAALPSWAAWNPEAAAVLVRRACDLTDTATWRDALGALLTACTHTGDPAPLLDLHARLSRPGPSEESGRDLPAHRRLATLAERAGEGVNWGREEWRLAETLWPPLVAGHLVPTEGLRLAVRAVQWTAPDLLSRLRRLADVADRPSLAWRVSGWIQQGLDGEPWCTVRPDLLPAATALAGDPGPTAALFAAAVTRSAGAWAGWTPPWRGLLHRLRRHPDPDVAEHAADTVTDPE